MSGSEAFLRYLYEDKAGLHALVDLRRRNDLPIGGLEVKLDACFCVFDNKFSHAAPPLRN